MYRCLHLHITSNIFDIIMAKLQRFGRIRQLHTIISQETIKPSSPTPPHLKTHNLSLLDQFAPNCYIPIVFFYPNYNKGNTTILKQSLSQCLTGYYPFAGRFLTPSMPYVDCNDQGVEFLEASIDSRIDKFILKKEQDETLDQLFPNGLGCIVGNTSPNLVQVQLNHFACGGVAVAVSMSHKVADASTVAKFINQWATITRGGTLVNPHFISSTASNNTEMPEFVLKGTHEVKYVRKRFVFPNLKLKELKKKVMSMSTSLVNPTRVEVLTSLLFKCAVGAATTKSGSLKPSNLFHVVNMRNKLVENCPEIAAGNIFSMVVAKMMGSGEIRMNEVIAELRKGKMELEGLRDVQEVGEKLANTLSTLGGDQSRAYHSSSLCRFSFYEVDFGSGKPTKVTVRIPDMDGNGLFLMDTPSGDGIEAMVNLEEEEMNIFQKDKELLAYVINA